MLMMVTVVMQTIVGSVMPRMGMVGMVAVVMMMTAVVVVEIVWVVTMVMLTMVIVVLMTTAMFCEPAALRSALAHLELAHLALILNTAIQIG